MTPLTMNARAQFSNMLQNIAYRNPTVTKFGRRIAYQHNVTKFRVLRLLGMVNPEKFGNTTFVRQRHMSDNNMWPEAVMALSDQFW